MKSWTVGDYVIDFDKPYHYNIMAGKMLVAKVYHSSGAGGRLHAATLIAAAPETAAERDRLLVVNAELLAALIETTESVAYAVDALQAPEKSTMREDLKGARAAIAKATQTEGDGTDGQDRESYSDNQDRDSYTT